MVLKETSGVDVLRGMDHEQLHYEMLEDVGFGPDRERLLELQRGTLRDEAVIAEGMKRGEL